MLDMNDLEDLVVNKRLDVRVVHLVRDARPLVQARSSADYGTVDGFHQHPAEGYTDEVDPPPLLIRNKTRLVKMKQI